MNEKNIDAMQDPKMDDFTEIMVECLNGCHERGMPLPWFFISVAVNGCMMYARYTPNEDTETLDCELLAQHITGPGFQLPINMIIIDSTGNAVRIVVDKEGIKFH